MKTFRFPKPGLSARLVVINSLGLMGFFAGILLLGQTRESLTDAYRQSLAVQAQIIAEALGESAGDETGGGQNLSLSDLPSGTAEKEAGQIMAPRLDAAMAEQILRRIIPPTSNRARLYDRKGALVIDSEILLNSDAVVSRRLPPPASDAAPPSTPPAQAQNQLPTEGQPFEEQQEEIERAMRGDMVTTAKRTRRGDDILTVAVPVQHYRAIIGVLLLTSPPGEIDRLVAEERNFLARMFLFLFAVTLVLSFALAGTITLPVRRLATAIQGFQQTGGPLPEPETVPDLSDRRDEIGNLSLALRDMLERLVSRLDTIENFAADVAHELKNPLASINSAVQSLSQTADEATRRELLAILESDVLRMNRLITDISEASRLDAELGRAAAERFNLSDLLRTMVPLMHPDIRLEIADSPDITGQKDRIAQIVRNLLDNALSFSQAAGDVTVILESHATGLHVHVDDAGPGLPEGVEEKIFDRFYTDRPDGHGVHSGLGLSISRQIARAHGGDLTVGSPARGRAGNGSGARFSLFLPPGCPESRS